MKTFKRCFIGFTLTLSLLLAGPLFLAACAGLQDSGSWRTADRSSAGIAPRPEQEQAAVVQVYGARAYNWRGYFSLHTWISTKEAGADGYYVHEVTGWRHYVVQSRPDDPDRAWYGAPPTLIADIRGEQAERIIDQLNEVIDRYPYPTEYTAWPGPNSNTFVADQYAVASMHSQSLAERMRSNRTGLMEGHYALAANGDAPTASADCAKVDCNPQELAAWDLGRWKQAVTGGGADKLHNGPPPLPASTVTSFVPSSSLRVTDPSEH